MRRVDTGGYKTCPRRRAGARRSLHKNDYMRPQSNLDLEIALQKIHELAMADGDLGYAYWHEVGQLLRRALGMQAEIDLLKRELEQFRAVLGRKARSKLA